MVSAADNNTKASGSRVGIQRIRVAESPSVSGRSTHAFPICRCRVGHTALARPPGRVEAVGLPARLPTALCLGGPHAMLAFSAVCAALVARTRTGTGQLVSTSLYRQGAYTVS